MLQIVSTAQGHLTMMNGSAAGMSMHRAQTDTPVINLSSKFTQIQTDVTSLATGKNEIQHILGTAVLDPKGNQSRITINAGLLQGDLWSTQTANKPSCWRL